MPACERRHGLESPDNTVSRLDADMPELSDLSFTSLLAAHLSGEDMSWHDVLDRAKNTCNTTRSDNTPVDYYAWTTKRAERGRDMLALINNQLLGHPCLLLCWRRHDIQHNILRPGSATGELRARTMLSCSLPAFTARSPIQCNEQGESVPKRFGSLPSFLLPI